MPIYILILDFPVKHAISLSSVTVLGGALASNFLNISKTHPDDDEKNTKGTGTTTTATAQHTTKDQQQQTTKRPCVDWDLLLQLEPPTLAGTLVGAALNAYLPGVVLVCLLLALLSLTAYKTLLKANHLYQKETSRWLQEQQDETATITMKREEETDSLLVTKNDGDTYGAVMTVPSVPVTSLRVVNPLRVEIWKAIIKMVALFVMITGLTLLKGDPEEESILALLRCGRYCYWYNQFLLLIIIGAFGVWTRSTILHRLHVLGGPILSDIDWNESNTIHYPVFAILAGIVAGLFGIGTYAWLCYVWHRCESNCCSLDPPLISIWTNNRRRYSERATHVGIGSSSYCRFRDFGCHDSLYQRYCHPELQYLRFRPIRLCLCLFCGWFHLCLVGTDHHVLFDETVPTSFLHCLFDWYCSGDFRRRHDGGVGVGPFAGLKIKIMMMMKDRWMMG